MWLSGSRRVTRHVSRSTTNCRACSQVACTWCWKRISRHMSASARDSCPSRLWSAKRAISQPSEFNGEPPVPSEDIPPVSDATSPPELETAPPVADPPVPASASPPELDAWLPAPPLVVALSKTRPEGSSVEQARSSNPMIADSPAGCVVCGSLTSDLASERLARVIGAQPQAQWVAGANSPPRGLPGAKPQHKRRRVAPELSPIWRVLHPFPASGRGDGDLSGVFCCTLAVEGG